MYNIIYIVYSFYEDNNRILVIFIMLLRKKMMLLNLYKLFKCDHSIEI